MYKEGPNNEDLVSQRQSFTEFIKCLLTQQLTKLTHLSRESGDFLHGDKELA